LATELTLQDETLCIKKMLTDDAMAPAIKVAGAVGADVNGILGEDGAITLEEYKAVIESLQEEAPVVKKLVINHFTEFFKVSLV
jgi:hypothetical protein